MKKYKSIVIFLLLLILIFVFVGCNNVVSVVSIEKTGENGLIDIYTITYSDGSTSTLEISNGRDGVDGNDGVDGESVSVEDVYQIYLEEHPDATYEDFLKEFLSVNNDVDSIAINKSLKSSAKIYTEFTESYRYGYGYGPNSQTVKDTAVYLGSAVIYKIADDYTYFITNYHVVYDYNAVETDKIAKKIVVYLYGSESDPISTNTQDANGCTIYDYGDYGINCEYVGGSITADVAIVKAKTEDVFNINDDVDEVIFADDYHVGETAIAIGNPEGEGLSVTQGVISVDNEYISLAIDNTTRSYRSIRIDTSIYSGSSGGGLFNDEGKLIGITNAGDGEDQNVNYAIPLEIVKYTVENIMYYATNGEKSAKKVTLGITVEAKNSKYVYDENLGYGEIVEKVYIAEVTEGSIAQSMGIEAGDLIVSVTVNDVEYNINRYFEIGDLLLRVRSGDEMIITYQRNDQLSNSSSYTVTTDDLVTIA